MGTENDLRKILKASIALFDALNDSHLELQFCSSMIKALISNHPNAVYLAFDIIHSHDLLTNVDSEDNDRNNLLLNVILSHFKHSQFIKECSTVILENNDKVPKELDAVSSLIFKQLFTLFTSNKLQNNESNKVLSNCLDAVRGLLSLQSFALIIKDLLFSNDDNTKKHMIKSLQLLKQQINQRSQRFKLNDVKCYLHELVIPLYDNILFQKKNKTEIDEMILCILDISIKKFFNYTVVRDWYLK